MSATPNGGGAVLEKSTHAPPSIAVTEVHDHHDHPDRPDAGLRSLDHYKRKLPPWRYYLRQKLLPFIRWETPYLAWMQDNVRSQTLDSYFAITANLGTHTFFMIVLPILFWCGHTSIARGLVHILSVGVFLTGFWKDMFSLPRPLSPPLVRITMSDSAVLEYGFPSTHSTNACSVATYALLLLHSPACPFQPSTKFVLEVASYIYASSIVLGRLYCGMHGYVDVIIGSIIGISLSFFESLYGTEIDEYILTGSWIAPFSVAVAIILLIKIHPEPADDCPCFDDSVAVAGVMIGIEVGGWHYAATNWAWNIPTPGAAPFDLAYLGWLFVVLRIVVGVLVIFLWREVMKPTLLRFLPHLFRFIARYGIVLPRKFFMPATEYNIVPARLKVDNIMPSISDLPGLLKSIRYPTRGRSVSVGPQSAADAYETLAYREKRRRDSLTNSGGLEFRAKSPRPLSKHREEKIIPSIEPTRIDRDGPFSQTSGIQASLGGGATEGLPLPAQSRVGTYEEMMGQGRVVFTPATASPDPEVEHESGESDAEIFVGRQDELDEKEMFMRLEKPRVRYDVEVVTKLVVYAGIGWLAVEVIPIIFELTGMGMVIMPAGLSAVVFLSLHDRVSKRFGQGSLTKIQDEEALKRREHDVGARYDVALVRRPN